MVVHHLYARLRLFAPATAYVLNQRAPADRVTTIRSLIFFRSEQQTHRAGFEPAGI